MNSTLLRTAPLLLLLLAVSCAQGCARSARERAAELPMIAAINDGPHLYENGSVTLHGEVDEVVGRRAFVMESDGSLFDAEILVLLPPGMDTAGMLEDEPLTVVGTVRRVYSGPDFAREHDLDLGAMTHALRPGAPVVVLDRLDRAVQSAGIP